MSSVCEIVDYNCLIEVSYLFNRAPELYNYFDVKLNRVKSDTGIKSPNKFWKRKKSRYEIGTLCGRRTNNNFKEKLMCFSNDAVQSSYERNFNGRNFRCDGLTMV